MERREPVINVRADADVEGISPIILSDLKSASVLLVYATKLWHLMGTDWGSCHLTPHISHKIDIYSCVFAKRHQTALKHSPRIIEETKYRFKSMCIWWLKCSRPAHFLFMSDIFSIISKGSSSSISNLKWGCSSSAPWWPAATAPNEIPKWNQRYCDGKG